MRFVIIIAWAWALLGLLAGCGVFVSGIVGYDRYGQETAISAIALVIVVIPYCFARIVSGLNADLRDEARERRDRQDPKA